MTKSFGDKMMISVLRRRPGEKMFYMTLPERKKIGRQINGPTDVGCYKVISEKENRHRAKLPFDGGRVGL
jgi:hypothetical protein